MKHAKSDRRRAAPGRQQAAQRRGEGAAAEADRSAMEALEQAEELQRHGDHEEPGDDGEDSLSRVERAVSSGNRCSLRRADDLAQGAGERAQEAVGRQAADIVEQMALGGRAPAARIAAQRTGKAAAHADAVEAAGKPGSKDISK